MKSIATVDSKFGAPLQDGALDSFFEQSVLKTLRRLTTGHLSVEWRGEVQTFGQNSAEADIVAHINVRHASVFRLVALNGTIGSAEAYMAGAWDTPDLVQVIRVFVANLDVVEGMDSRWNFALKTAANIAHRLNKNSKHNAKQNIAAHYDLGNDFFKLFLDSTMLYSSAIFPSKDASLYEASMYKMKHICERLDLTDGEHLLEIGSGWGGMAVYAAKYYGCKVTTVTLSKEQCAFAQDWVKREGLEHLVTVKLTDYRDIDGQFDKLLSIEMIEAVGYQYFSTYFKKCSSLLKPNGKMLIQAITISDQRYLRERDNVDFIQRYIFPGGCLPSNEVIAKHVRMDTDMQIVGLEDITLDYARTLAKWRTAFWANISDVYKQGFDKTFTRMWDFYLAYCEGGFTERVIHTSQFLMAKPKCRHLPKI